MMLYLIDQLYSDNTQSGKVVHKKKPLVLINTSKGRHTTIVITRNDKIYTKNYNAT